MLQDLNEKKYQYEHFENKNGLFKPSSFYKVRFKLSSADCKIIADDILSYIDSIILMSNSKLRDELSTKLVKHLSILEISSSFQVEWNVENSSRIHIVSLNFSLDQFAIFLLNSLLLDNHSLIGSRKKHYSCSNSVIDIFGSNIAILSQNRDLFGKYSSSQEHNNQKIMDTLFKCRHFEYNSSEEYQEFNKALCGLTGYKINTYYPILDFLKDMAHSSKLHEYLFDQSLKPLHVLLGKYISITSSKHNNNFILSKEERTMFQTILHEYKISSNDLNNLIQQKFNVKVDCSDWKSIR